MRFHCEYNKSFELGFTNNPGYNSSKGAKSLTKSLATDLAKFNIRVNNIGPGYIKTKMTKASFIKKKEIKDCQECL